jgi:IclR family transcriptional regulator, pca regulon regulatory protein
VYVARFVSTKFVPIHMPIGSRIPMYCTGSGRAFLSALPPEEARVRLDGMARTPHTPRTVTALDELVALLDSARLEGYATNQEELFIGDMSIAAPVLGSQGQPVAAVHVVAPTSRWTLDDARRKLAPAVIDCARGISNSIRTLE